MKRLATILSIFGPIVLVGSFYFLMIAYPPGTHPDVIIFTMVPLLILSVIATCIGPVLFAFRLPLQRRKLIATIIMCVSLAMMAIGVALEYTEFGGEGQMLVIGTLIFSFSYGTLALKNKYDKWKVYTRSGRASFLLSLTDSIGLASLFLGMLFRLMRWPMAAALIVIGIILVIVGIIAWNRRFKKEVVYRKETEDKLQDSYRQLEEKQKEITDSITYAKRIQQSLLAHSELLKKGLADHFVLYLPKDIVSGDFYWATDTPDSFYLAVCDSTGHGVPGAFMSLLNTTFLNEAINEKKIVEPHQIFEHVRRQLIANISHQGGQDGMDGILLRMEKSSRNITYCGANNAPIVVKNSEALECASDKMPVGIGERMAPYTLHRLAASSGDMIYLSTDGYADQFGGERGKKMKRSGLRILLTRFAHLPSAEQRNKFESTFAEWRGSLEQLDDVCIVGIRIP